ncbi:MAG: DUF1631 domain-containing protein [Pseudomonadota bacterium]
MAANQNEMTDDVDRPDPAGASHSPPLIECRDIAAQRLRPIVSRALEHLKPEFLRVIDMAMGADIYYLYMGALELLRDQQREIESTFRKAYLRRFNQACREDAHPPERPGTPGGLSLVDADDLEESLAIDALANAIRDNCVEELFALDQRVGFLINDPELHRYENPLGPGVIARALMDALDGPGVEIKARLLVMAQLAKWLPDDIRELYAELNQALVKRNILPTIRIGLRRGHEGHPGHDTGTRVGGPGPGGEPSYPGPMPGPGGPGMNPYAGQAYPGAGQAGAYPDAGYSGGPGSMAPPGANGYPGAGTPGGGSYPPGYMPPPGSGPGLTGGGGGAPLPSGAIVEGLNLLQRGQADAVAWAGVSPDALASGRINVLHNLRQGPLSAANEVDTLTLDIVAMMFDYILDDDRIPDAMKALIGRLQIPVLKVAMLDKSFFSKKGHHVRKLLNGLAEAAISLDSSGGSHESAVYKKVEALVGRVLEQFDDGVEIYTEVLNDLNAFLATEQHKVDLAVVRGIEALQAREAAEQSKAAAHEAVLASLAGQQIPLAIQDFIVRYWQTLLARVHEKSGPDSPSWRIALSTMANLIWSVQPKHDQVERSSLVALIPSLLKELNMGADSLSMPIEDRELFFATLVPCHTLALKAITLEGEMTAQPVMVPAEVPPMVESNEFEPVPVAPVASLGPAARRAPPPVPPPSAESVIEGLRLGSWVECTRDDGSVVKTRLAWISPMKGIYLFANRDGESVLSITVRGLQAKVRSGEVRVIDDAPLMDRIAENLSDSIERVTPEVPSG